MGRKHKYAAIIVLVALLTIIIGAVATTVVYDYVTKKKMEEETAEEEQIQGDEPDEAVSTPKADDEKIKSVATPKPGDDSETGDDDNDNTGESDSEGGDGNSGGGGNVNDGRTGGRWVKVEVMSFYKLHADGNERFSVENMFPGDEITKNYCVKVYCKAPVNVHFSVEYDENSILADALQLRIYRIDTDTLIFEGYVNELADFAISAGAIVDPGDNTFGLADYDITAYIDTSVGNAYQEQELVVDFMWWIDSSDVYKLYYWIYQTGDSIKLIAYAALSAFSAGVIILIIIAKKRRKQEEAEDEALEACS